MEKRAYSKSLKTLRKYEFFDNGMNKIMRMEQQIKRQQDIMKPRQSPIKSIIEAKKQLISHKFSKNVIEKQLDEVIRSMVKGKTLDISCVKVNRKHSYKHYRIETQPQSVRKNKSKPTNLSKSKKSIHTDRKMNPEILLPKISNSQSKKTFEKLYSRELKTEQDVFERLNQDPRQKILEYINIDNVIKQYRAGMTSLIKGVYSNPHNPYKNLH